MDIRIGFADTARELTLRATGTQEELTRTINAAVDQGTTLELEDDKGQKYLIRTDRVVYVAVGPAKARTVGFAGA
ncbi:DUF3107 domain-containing protein [Corynebacterium lizhenjunii]|uniref:DUF3107 domain-containing protein n=1 Tax=Corynebacterium lizhenjunii TaxID=2709394 RepID=A0A7T0PB27_9CORY|nr:DUF3107 domain-containing protein [Corynebacterium lizhenjunii]QPK79711.1 DUF3107 domain-containing protein [Corynebacterium lizhenjunii]